MGVPYKVTAQLEFSYPAELQRCNSYHRHVSFNFITNPNVILLSCVQFCELYIETSKQHFRVHLDIMTVKTVKFTN